jgi:hypothetical protein
MRIRLSGALISCSLMTAAALAATAVVLPVVVFKAEPVLVVIPGTYVYVIPDRDDDFFFHEGYWWRPHGGFWYRSTIYNGPWVVVERPVVPPPLIGLPPGWRHLPPGLARVRYAQVRDNWRRWHKDKYWEKDPHWHVKASAPPPGKVKSPPPGQTKGAPPGHTKGTPPGKTKK